MSEERRSGVYLTRRDGPASDQEKAVATPRKSRVGLVSTLIVTVCALLLFTVVMVIRYRETPVTPVIAARPVERSMEGVAGAGEVDMSETDGGNALAKTEVAHKTIERAQNKICRSLARELIDIPTPTREQMRRTLMVYSINKCSNEYIRNQDAENRGLTQDELAAIATVTEVGPLRAEDR